MILFSIFFIFVCFPTVQLAVLETSDHNQTSQQAEFLVTNRNEIWRVDQNGEKHRYITNATSISDVDYHLRKKILFWIDTERREIHSQPLDVNSTAFSLSFKQQRVWEPLALAVDFINDKVYVADNAGMKIDVFELDGKHHGIALGTDLVNPLDIKIDPYEGFMFLLDGFRIIRASMDGSSPITVIRQGIRDFHGLSIDVINKQIYWARNTDFELMKADYLGRNLTSAGTSSYLIWTKFAPFNGSIFWASDFVQFKANCCPEKLGAPRKTIYQSNPVPTIKVLHNSIQKLAPNPCANNNGGCQHLCILTSKNDISNSITYRCACNVGWQLDNNLRNCSRVNEFLMYAQPTVLKSHFTSNCTSAFCDTYLPVKVTDKSKFQDFDYDYRDNYLYFIANRFHLDEMIYRVHPNESKIEVFANHKNENYQSLALDWITKNLYFTDSIRGSINVISTKNNLTKLTLLKNLENPEDIVVHPNKGFLFFTQTNKITKLTVLSRINSDGSNLITLPNVTLQKPCGFMVDIKDNRIYWYSYTKKYVQHSNLDGTDIKFINNPLTKHVYTIAAHENWIYLVTIGSNGIQRFDKEREESSELILQDFANRITKVKVFSPQTRKIDEKHPCIMNNGDCLHFCFGLLEIANNSWTKVCANSTEEIVDNQKKCSFNSF